MTMIQCNPILCVCRKHTWHYARKTNYNFISSYITHGVMILVKEHVPILDNIHTEEKNVEVVLAFFFPWNKSCNTESVCCSPCSILQHSWCYFQCIGHFHLNRPIVLVGDFNIDMLQNNVITKELENYMCKCNLRFLLNNINHVQNTLIDHVWSNVPISQYNVFILDTYWSDHDTIGITLELWDIHQTYCKIIFLCFKAYLSSLLHKTKLSNFLVFPGL